MIRVEWIGQPQPESIRYRHTQDHVHEHVKQVPNPRVVLQEQEHHLQENLHADERKHNELKSSVHDRLHVCRGSLRVDVSLSQDHYLHLEFPDVPCHTAKNYRHDGHVKDGKREEAQVAKLVQLVRQREHNQQEDARHCALDLGKR